MHHYTFPGNVLPGPDMYPEIFNIPSDTSNSCSIMEGSRPRPLFNNGKGEDDGCALSNSSSLYLKKKKCEIVNPEANLQIYLVLANCETYLSISKTLMLTFKWTMAILSTHSESMCRTFLALRCVTQWTIRFSRCTELSVQ